MTTSLYILGVLPLFLIVMYNIRIFNYGFFPSIAFLLTKCEFRFSKGYDFSRMLTITTLTITSLYLLILCIELLKSGFYEKSTLSFICSLPCALGIILTYKFVKAHSPYTLKGYQSLYRDKNVKDIDLLEKRAVNFNSLKTQVNNNLSTKDTASPFLQNLNQRELDYKIISHSRTISIDEINKKYLLDFFEGYDIPNKIEIEVNSDSNNLNYRAGIDFLNEIIETENVLIPNTNSYFTNNEIANFVNDNFTLISSKGTPKKRITANQFFYKKYLPKLK